VTDEVCAEVERLRWERPADEPTRSLYYELIAPIDTWDSLVARLRESSSVGNMNLLFSSTACAFYDHYKMTFV
jgi:hypothetical protein